MTPGRAKALSLFLRGLCLLALPGLIWLTLRNAAIALFAQAQPSLALAFPPPSGTALAVDAAERRRPPEVRERIAAEALRRDPISPWPFVAAAEAALERADPASAQALFEASIRRSSRHVEPRRRLFQLYLAEGRWSEAIDEGIAVARLRPSAAVNVMGALLLLLDDPRGRAVLAAKLRPGPDGGAPAWQPWLEAAAAGHPRRPQLTFLLRQIERESAEPGADPPVGPER